MPWYYANNNQRLGPVSDSEFARLVREKIIREDTLVWRHGMADWKPYAEVVATPPPLEAPVVVEAAAKLREEVGASSFTVPDAKAVLAEHPVELCFASFWLRAGAAIIDWLVVLGVGRIIAWACGVSNLNLMPLAEGNMNQLVPLLQQLSVYVFADTAMRIAYHWFFLGKYEATPGKMVFGLRVVRRDGSRLSQGQIIGRFFAEIVSKYFTLGFGYLMVAFDSENRALHDQICDTRVVTKRRI
jgi:uncharacterized RDD family membrane protein YckC